MPITVKCGCGRSLKARDEMAGKKARCPTCSALLSLPPPLPAVVEEEPLEVDLDPATEDDARADEPTDEDGDAREPRRKSRSTRKPKKIRRHVALFDKPSNNHGDDGGWFGDTNAGIVGGLVMILVAILWLSIGIYFGWIFYYPVILLFIGVIAIAKGLIG